MYFSLSLYFATIWLILVITSSSSSEECLNMGFNPISLQCETCDVLLRVVGDEDLLTDCKKCCSRSAGKETFEKAVIEVDKRFLTSFPNLKPFVESIYKKSSKSKRKEKDQENGNADKLNGVTVRYRFGSRPTLMLYKSKEDDVPAESLYIGSWETGMVVTFLFQ